MEKVLLVGLDTGEAVDFDKDMKELAALAEACDMDVVDTVVQNLAMVNKALYIGKGKVVEVRELAEEKDVDVVIFDNALSPSQLRNLQDDLDVPVMDRTTLILEIFFQRAKTREAKLQVEVAQLQYALPRLVGLHDALSRQGGSSGFSNKGSGEKKLELDRRKIEKRLSQLRRELEDVERERETRRKLRKRRGTFLVALVGYTNAGKSTIMNRMVETYMVDEQLQENKKVLEQDMLFATLDTTIRNIKIDRNTEFLLSDTVGFISKLPHHLVKAFRSTLEEVCNADLLIQVVDYSDESYKEQMAVTRETLEELEAGHIPVLAVYNKADLKEVEIPRVMDSSIFMCAKDKVGLDELVEMITKQMQKDYVACSMLIPFADGNVYSYLKENAVLDEVEYEEDGIRVSGKCKVADYKRYEKFVV